MESKNWRVTPGEEPAPCDENWEPVEKQPVRMFGSNMVDGFLRDDNRVKEFLAKFLKEYGRHPNRREFRAALRKQKREAKV